MYVVIGSGYVSIQRGFICTAMFTWRFLHHKTSLCSLEGTTFLPDSKNWRTQTTKINNLNLSKPPISFPSLSSKALGYFALIWNNYAKHVTSCVRQTVYNKPNYMYNHIAVSWVERTIQDMAKFRYLLLHITAFTFIINGKIHSHFSEKDWQLGT